MQKFACENSLVASAVYGTFNGKFPRAVRTFSTQNVKFTFKFKKKIISLSPFEMYWKNYIF